MSTQEDRVLKAAERLVTEMASLEFNMRQVASAAGVSLRTVYESYPTKDDLLLAIYSGAMRTLAELIMPAIDACTTPEDKLRAFVEGAILTVRGRPVSEAVLRERNHLATTRPAGVRLALQPFRRLIEGLLAEIEGERLPSQKLFAEVILTTVMAHCHGLVSGVLTSSRRAVADAVLVFVMRGVRVPEDAAIL